MSRLPSSSLDTYASHGFTTGKSSSRPTEMTTEVTHPSEATRRYITTIADDHETVREFRDIGVQVQLDKEEKQQRIAFVLSPVSAIYSPVARFFARRLTRGTIAGTSPDKTKNVKKKQPERLHGVLHARPEGADSESSGELYQYSGTGHDEDGRRERASQRTARRANALSPIPGRVTAVASGSGSGQDIQRSHQARSK